MTKRLFNCSYCANGRSILVLSDGGGMSIAKAVDAEVAAEIATALNLALDPDRAVLLDMIGERIADEVEKVATGRQSDCENAAKDILAMAFPGMRNGW